MASAHTTLPLPCRKPPTGWSQQMSMPRQPARHDNRMYKRDSSSTGRTRSRRRIPVSWRVILTGNYYENRRCFLPVRCLWNTYKLNYGQDNTFYLRAIDKIRSCTPKTLCVWHKILDRGRYVYRDSWENWNLPIHLWSLFRWIGRSPLERLREYFIATWNLSGSCRKPHGLTFLNLQVAIEAFPGIIRHAS